MTFIRFASLFLVCLGLPFMAQAQDSGTATPPADQGISFFAFFDIGDTGDADHAITASEFETIINEIEGGTYDVLSIDNAVDSLISNQITQSPSVVLTFDGGYRSFFDNAWPLIKQKRLPITLFITPEQIDRRSSYFMSWDELEDVADEGFVTIGLQADIYIPYPERGTQEIHNGLNRALARFEEKLGEKPAFIAYPYGLYDEQVLDILSEYTFIKGGFGLQSSVAYAGGTPSLTIPRFPMAGEYGHIDRFRMLARALPLPVHDIVPSRTTMVQAKNPLIGFTLDKSLLSMRDKLACFASDIGRLEPEFLGEDRVEIRPSVPLGDKRTRINCTLPHIDSLDGMENWRWFGLVIRPEDSPTITPHDAQDDTAAAFTSQTQPVLP